jgi:hypothetical protein
MLLHAQWGICFSLDTFILGDVKKQFRKTGHVPSPFYSALKV